LTSRGPKANLAGGGPRTVFGLYSSLFTLAFSSVAWPSGVGVTLGALVGLGLAYLLIDRVVRAQVEAPQSTTVRRIASLACLLWGMTLPLAFAAAGLVWGVGSGVGGLVEGPISTTVRETTHTWLTAANGLGVGVLKRLPLAKRLSERELLTVVQAAPDVISEALDQDKVGAFWQRATGSPMPPQLAPVLRHEFRALTGRIPRADGSSRRLASPRCRAPAQPRARGGRRPAHRAGGDRSDGLAGCVPRRGERGPRDDPARRAQHRPRRAADLRPARRRPAARVEAARARIRQRSEHPRGRARGRRDAA
jgi:hypothetical protein